MKVQRATYYYATVHDEPGEAYRLLSTLAESGVHLLAFSAIPMGGDRTQLMLFPESVARLAEAAANRGLDLTGPENALLCRGDDGLGAFADIHRRLCDADVNVYASSGVTADCGRFGYVLYVRADQFEEAARVLGI
jgi:hypothetical protein